LLHPESLRQGDSGTGYARLLDNYYRATDAPPGPSLNDQLCWLLGLDILRGRVLARVLPAPLPGEFGWYYGFTSDLWRHLSSHGGSAIDPRSFLAGAGQGNAEYRLAAAVQEASRRFREAMPAGARLAVGITPVPAGFAGSGHGATRDRMLEQWSRWLQADLVLSDLPATLPDSSFATTTHLTATAARAYSDLVSAQLRRMIERAR
jgi:hypothetical protein